VFYRRGYRSVPVKKIVQVGNIQTQQPNGVHAATRRLTTMLNGDGVSVEVWRFSRRVAQPRRRRDGGIDVVDLPVHGARGRVGAYLQVPTRATREWIRRNVEEVGIFHLHSVFQPDHIWVSRIGLPYVITPHGGYDPATLGGFPGRVKKALVIAHERPLLEDAQAVQVLSRVESAHVRNIAPRSERQLLPFPLHSLVDTAVPYKEDGHILFVGRLDIRHKGLDLLLDGVAQRREILVRHRLVLIGPEVDGSVRHLKDRINNLGINGLVEIRPPVESANQLTNALAEAAVFVHTSRREGLPTAVLEAMQVGLPVVISEATNLGDFVGNHQAGLVVPGSVSEIAEGISDFLSMSPAVRREMGRHGRDAVLGAFSWDSLRERYLGFYGMAQSA
jgi:glycosyltransferase involved in cell wall biosynthesis